MATTNDLLVDYNYPLKVVNKNANKDIDVRSKDRIWYSQPRLDTDRTWEILRISLRTPIQITHISFGLLNRSCLYEVWVTSNDTRLKLLDSDLNYVEGTVAGGDNQSVGVTWRTIDTEVNPIIISQIELRQKRNSSPGVGQLISLGVRDLLMKRTVKTQDDTLYSLSKEVDILGNPVRREVQDWRASLATDDDAFTFWKSGPQPSPDAVVNFYSTVGDGTNPQRIDRIWIDPVYSGQNLNVYYSTDPTVGTIAPKPHKVPTNFVNNTIIADKGVDLTDDTFDYTIDTTQLLSQAGIPLNLIGVNGWIGGEFELGTITNTITRIFENPAATDFTLRFDSSTRRFLFTNNFLGHPNSKVQSSAVDCSTGDRIQWVISVTKNVDTSIVTLRLIIAVSGLIVSDTSFADINNETLVSLYGPTSSLLFGQKIGFLRNLIIKVTNDTDNQYLSFISDPVAYLQPHTDVSVQPRSFVIQSNLDNAILVGPYTTGEDAYGGIGEEFYTEKLWTPVWKDWTVQRGYYYLPAPIAACHIKLEFSKLTEQPYPIYETGITVPYKTFPTYVVHSSASAGQESVSPSTTNPIANPVTDSAFARQYAPKTPIVFGSKIVGNIRNRNNYDYKTLINESLRSTSLRAANFTAPVDVASSVVQQYGSITNNYSANPGSSDDPNTNSINSKVLKSTAINNSPSTTLGTRTPSWWYLPGGLKLSATTMNQITQNSTQTERFSNSSDTSTLRTRFAATSVHRYQTKYAVRDVGLAYFAGIRGFQVFTVDKTIPVDSDEYTVISYSDDAASSTNMRLGASGSQLGSYPSASTGQTIFKTWNSIATFIKVGVKTVDRGLHSDTKGSDVEPIGLDNAGGFWDDNQVTWSDSINVWGSNTALVGLDFQSNLYFSGREAVKIFRAKGVGAAGIKTRIFDLVVGDRIRLCASIFRPKATSNRFTLQLVDETPITGSVIFQQDISAEPGRWQTLKTDYYKMLATYSNLRVYLLIDGTQEETLYLSDLYDEETSIIYSLSNDNGVTYYEATEILDDPTKFLIFPKPGNQLKVKIDMLDHRDFGFGFTVKPYYLF